MKTDAIIPYSESDDCNSMAIMYSSHLDKIMIRFRRTQDPSSIISVNLDEKYAIILVDKMTKILTEMNMPYDEVEEFHP
jgi:hypothetical protein